MDVILLKNVENVGRMGQRVAVSRGYARNYLVPRGLALVATEGAAKVAAQKIQLEKKREDLRKQDAEALKAKFGEAGLTLVISAQAGDEDQLYGSVAARDIVAALAAQGVEVDPRQVLLDDPIKHLGLVEVPVRLHAEVQLVVKVDVQRAS